MRFEDVLSEVGVFGKFQILSLTILCLPRVILPLHFLLHIFISAVPPHHCRIPERRNPGNLSKADLVLINLPREPDGAFSSCEMFSEPQPHLLHNRSQRAMVNRSWVQSCDQGWDYDRTTFYSTTVTQWDLVCDRKWMNQAAATFFFMGLTTGSLICGFLSDRFGRRRILLLSFLPWSGRTSLIALSAARTAGYMFLALLAYLIRDWRWLLLATTSPCLLAIATWWWVPESARWLLTKHDAGAAHRYLSRCATMNGRPEFNQKISPEVLQKTISVGSRKYNFWDLVRTRQLRKNTLCLGVMWFGVAFSYYGISFHVTGFSLSPYLTHFIFGAIEIPAKVGVYLLLDRIGRKRCQGWSLIITSACIGLTCLIPLGHWRSVVAILGKGFSEASFTTAFLFTAELYPTVLRQTGLGFCSFMTRLGSSVAPLVILLDDLWPLLPSVVFSSMSLLSGAAAFFLTETCNIQLRETIQEVERHRDLVFLRVAGGNISTYGNGQAPQRQDPAEDSMQEALPQDSAPGAEESAQEALPQYSAPGAEESAQEALPQYSAPGAEESAQEALPQYSGPGAEESVQEALPQDCAPGAEELAQEALPQDCAPGAEESAQEALPQDSPPGAEESAQEALPQDSAPGAKESAQEALPQDSAPGAEESAQEALPQDSAPGAEESAQEALPQDSAPGAEESAQEALPQDSAPGAEESAQEALPQDSAPGAEESAQEALPQDSAPGAEESAQEALPQ
ncbi:solute carrier family 22 member 7-like [Dendropsophus ebraccatus]|uniref:solute carrier family 22 member 7-like n=1 Tax=Dendropsophus ebraccatus TaxID=150705 RepID=UPI00383149ED